MTERRPGRDSFSENCGISLRKLRNIFAKIAEYLFENCGISLQNCEISLQNCGISLRKLRNIFAKLQNIFSKIAEYLFENCEISFRNCEISLQICKMFPPLSLPSRTIARMNQDHQGIPSKP